LELKKQPETEMEYWETIEALGGFVWRMNHDLGDGRIEDPDGEIAQAIEEGKQILNRLATELSEKFGVIQPKDYPKTEPGQERPPAPEGKIYYWDWYQKMKDAVYRSDYEKIICSACPFSEGVEKMKIGIIPCSVFPGVAYRLTAPHICLMTDWGGRWTKERLYQEIIAKGGEEALQTFKEKEKELQLGSFVLKQVT